MAGSFEVLLLIKLENPVASVEHSGHKQRCNDQCR